MGKGKKRKYLKIFIEIMNGKNFFNWYERGK